MNMKGKVIMKYKHLRILLIALVAVSLSLIVGNNVMAQNFTEMGKIVTEATVQGAEGAEDIFTVESLAEEVSPNVEIAALVDESQIPNLPAGELSRYTLGATDVIQIAVMRHPEVSGEYMINKEGKVQYGFVGDLKIRGLTKDEAKVLITKTLEEYIISPEVTVTITGYNSKIVYVVGEVSMPGKIFMRGDTITVREALMQAGLPMLTGITKKSRLITPSKKGKGNKKDINVYALLYEGDLRENDIMHPGDVLYIPPTFLTKAMRAISPVSGPINAAKGTGRAVTTGF